MTNCDASEQHLDNDNPALPLPPLNPPGTPLDGGDWVPGSIGRGGCVCRRAFFFSRRGGAAYSSGWFFWPGTTRHLDLARCDALRYLAITAAHSACMYVDDMQY